MIVSTGNERVDIRQLKRGRVVLVDLGDEHSFLQPAHLEGFSYMIALTENIPLTVKIGGDQRIVDSRNVYL